jgi:hypothetical protein
MACLYIPQLTSPNKHVILGNKSLHHSPRILPQILFICTTKINNKYQEKGAFCVPHFYKGYMSLIPLY